MAHIVNMFAGPGAGKTTMTADLFVFMRRRSHDVELAHEFAKDLIFSGQEHVLADHQLSVVAEQFKRLSQVAEAVGDTGYVITDAPLLLQRIYMPGSDAWSEIIRELMRAARTRLLEDGHTETNLLINRGNRLYRTMGRLQTEEEARALDLMVHKELTSLSVPYTTISHNNVEEAYNTVLWDVQGWNP